MKIPKIVFQYSCIYDEMWKNKTNAKNYPTERKTRNYINKVEKLWKIYEKKTLTELSKITKLNWKERETICYVVGRCIPFSDPLTMSVYRKQSDFIDTLIHEMIHRLFIQKGNYEKCKKGWDYFFRKYKNETLNTKIHIQVHAIHSHIYLKFFNKKRLERDVKLISHLKDYKRAWEIVQKEGYENIIKEFAKRVG